MGETALIGGLGEASVTGNVVANEFAPLTNFGGALLASHSMVLNPAATPLGAALDPPATPLGAPAVAITGNVFIDPTKLPGAPVHDPGAARRLGRAQHRDRSTVSLPSPGDRRQPGQRNGVGRHGGDGDRQRLHRGHLGQLRPGPRHRPGHTGGHPAHGDQPGRARDGGRDGHDAGGHLLASDPDQFTYLEVTGVSPNTGLGGKLVRVTGSGFTGATSVNFGTNNPGVAPLITQMGTELTVTSPPGHGTVDVTVTTPAGTSPPVTPDQFTYLDVTGVVDGAGHVYPIALIGDTFWMLENYRFPADGSYIYADNPGNEATFGRLYDARAQPPGGWSLPTSADWNALFEVYGDASAAYAALIEGGRSGFNAELGGQRAIQPDGSGIYEQMYVYGYYRASPGIVCAQFSSVSGRATVGTPVSDPRTALSVRFIRHV